MATENTIELQTMRYEAACTKHGKPCYRWRIGYCVPTSAGYLPPLPRHAAFATARELHGDSVKIVIR